jgi:hypothetical protein
VAASGTTIFNPYRGLELSVTTIVPPEAPTLLEATDTLLPVAKLTVFGVFTTGEAVTCGVVPGELVTDELEGVGEEVTKGDGVGLDELNIPGNTPE